MGDLSRRLFIGGAAGATAVGVSMMSGASADAQYETGYLGPKLRLSVLDFGVRGDGTVDDGALLTAGLAEKLGTFETVGYRRIPVEIDFGDLTLHLNSPIIIQQGLIEFMGSPKFYCNVVQNAIIVNAGNASATVFGVKIKGTIFGHVQGDGVLYQQGSQGEIDIRNVGYVGGSVVHLQGSYRTDVRVHSDGEGHCVCYHAYRESPLMLPAGAYNSINSNIFVVAYACYGAAVTIEESQGFDLRGDIERAVGPGVDIYNCQNGVVSVYTEMNGLGATNRGYDTPDDIRIRSGPYQTTPNSDGMIVHAARVGGERITVGGELVTPTSVHVINAWRTFIEASALGGHIRLESEALYTMVGPQSRFLGELIDNGQWTVDQSTIGRTVVKAGPNRRLVMDGVAPGGAMVGSDDGLLRLYGISSFGSGTTPGNNFTGSITISGNAATGRVNFGAAEPDGHYFPMVSLVDVSGGSASTGYKIRNLSAGGFDIALDAAPGGGQTIRAHYVIVRNN